MSVNISSIYTDITLILKHILQKHKHTLATTYEIKHSHLIEDKPRLIDRTLGRFSMDTNLHK